MANILTPSLIEEEVAYYDFSYSGKALITGGAGGIGKQTAIEFAKLGINLYLMDYNGTMLDKTVKEIKTAYPKIQVKSKDRVKVAAVIIIWT